MSISEILMLLTLIVTIVHVTFEITWKLEQREKHHDNDKKKNYDARIEHYNGGCVYHRLCTYVQRGGNGGRYVERYGND